MHSWHRFIMNRAGLPQTSHLLIRFHSAWNILRLPQRLLGSYLDSAFQSDARRISASGELNQSLADSARCTMSTASLTSSTDRPWSFAAVAKLWLSVTLIGVSITLRYALYCFMVKPPTTALTFDEAELEDTNARDVTCPVVGPQTKEHPLPLLIDAPP